MAQKTGNPSSAQLTEDIFTGAAEWEGDEYLISIDERSAILSYSIQPSKDFKNTHQASGVKLEIDCASIPDQMTVGEPGKPGVGKSATNSWLVIDLPGGSGIIQKASGPRTFRIEIKTGVFAALELNPKASVTKTTIKEVEFTQSQKQTVNLKMRVSCRYEPIAPPVPQRIQDLETVIFDLRD